MKQENNIAKSALEALLIVVMLGGFAVLVTTFGGSKASAVVGGPLSDQPFIVADAKTNRVSAATTNSASYNITGAAAAGPIGRVDCRGGKDVALEISFKQFAGTGSSNFYGFVFRKGLTFGNTTNYASDNQVIWVNGSGTGTNRLVTNITVNAISDYYLYQIWHTNADADVITNILVRAVVK